MVDSDIETGPAIESGLLDTIYMIFMRVVALSCLMSALYYWGRLTGYTMGGGFRFDLLPAHWQLAIACLSVLFPIAALGLWLGAAWGVVIWCLAAGGEVAMYHFMTNLFGTRPFVVLLSMMVAGLFVALRLAMALRNWQERRQGRK
ncbi:MAG: hypothetical protein CME90_03000 [Hoeflea sp.]|nr:hypothetical protein [Hoeflea sp.]|tara:strand:- start:3417 stop:3854 length:438 start_codon:yes stop_codon:yes gene_type:complete